MPAARPRRLAARWGQFLLAMACFGVAIALMLRSGLGLGSWDAFHAGLSNLTGLTIGEASVLTGFVVLVGSMAMGVRPGAGTWANMVLVGAATDVALPLVPRAGALGGGIALGVGYYGLAILIGGFATGMYIAAALGAGPRDGLMVALSARFQWPVRRVKTLIEATALAAGWAMGGRLGLGTLLFIVGAGPATQWGMRRFGLLGADGEATESATRGRRGASPASRSSGDRAA